MDSTINERTFEHERLQTIIDELGIDIVRKLVAMFEGELGEKLVALARSLQARDEKELRRLAHSLKGAAYNVGARRLGVLCHRIESLAQSSGLDQVQPFIDEITSESAKVRVELVKMIKTDGLENPDEAVAKHLTVAPPGRQDS